MWLIFMLPWFCTFQLPHINAVKSSPDTFSSSETLEMGSRNDTNHTKWAMKLVNKLGFTDPNRNLEKWNNYFFFFPNVMKIFYSININIHSVLLCYFCFSCVSFPWSITKRYDSCKINRPLIMTFVFVLCHLIEMHISDQCAHRFSITSSS